MTVVLEGISFIEDIRHLRCFLNHNIFLIERCFWNGTFLPMIVHGPLIYR